MNRWFAPLLLVLCVTIPAYAQEQTFDPDADVSVAKPAFAKDAGPVVLIDEAHHNYHTAEARFKPFADLLRNDGFKVSGSQVPFATAVLARGRVLVVANALNQVNVDHWQLPTPPAFTPTEITAVRTWVEGGGSLLLIADHMPFAGAVSDFARAFGFTFINGFAFHLPPKPGDLFTRADGTLKADPVTAGITSVMSFTGSAFLAPATARPLMEFPKGYQVLMPKVAWEFSPSTPTQDAAGALQGASMNLGKGRLAVFGEAGMFTAQALNGNTFGFNSPDAPENKAFILNVARWLAAVSGR